MKNSTHNFYSCFWFFYSSAASVSFFLHPQGLHDLDRQGFCRELVNRQTVIEANPVFNFEEKETLQQPWVRLSLWRAFTSPPNGGHKVFVFLRLISPGCSERGRRGQQMGIIPAENSVEKFSFSDEQLIKVNFWFLCLKMLRGQVKDANQKRVPNPATPSALF